MSAPASRAPVKSSVTGSDEPLLSVTKPMMSAAA